MKIVCVGGGSGGHVTPVLSVINELSKLDPTLQVSFVCDKAFEEQSRGKMKLAPVPVDVHVIAAGKLRRYHGIPLWKQLLDIPTVLKNFRDFALIATGFIQSIVLLRREKPDVVFAKGGYVCLPLGYATKVLGIPLVIHDSDTRPGLTNRLLSRFASAIATGSPLSNYNYPKNKSFYTGVPIDTAFRPFTFEEQQRAKEEIGVKDSDKPLIVVTGGGLGAESINMGVLAVAEDILKAGYSVYHVTGKRHYEAVKAEAPVNPDYLLAPFVYENMPAVLGAADIVISRASATFLQELAALAKPSIIIPAAHLGDQIKNAEVYKNEDAAVVLDDIAVRQGTALYEAVQRMREAPQDTAAMAKRFGSFAKAHAAEDVARLVVSQVRGKEREKQGNAA